MGIDYMARAFWRTFSRTVSMGMVASVATESRSQAVPAVSLSWNCRGLAVGTMLLRRGDASGTILAWLSCHEKRCKSFAAAFSG